MQAAEIVRVVAAILTEGDEVPMAELSAAVPHFSVRLTAICIERRDLGILREFILRAIASGFHEIADIAGFLGVGSEEVQAELIEMEAEFFVATSNGNSPRFILREKGRVAISKNGLPKVAVREAGCYVNGVTRRIEQISGELVPRRKLSTGTLVLPAIPARAPRIDELDVPGVRTAMYAARNALPRALEISRLGRVVRTTSLYQPAHLFLRRGIHSVPMICVNGAVDSDLARRLGAHPSLQGLKAAMERNEKQVRHALVQLRPKLNSRSLADPAVLRHACASFVALSDANDTQRSVATGEFSKAAEALIKASHWLGGAERQVLFAWATMSAKQRLIVVAPPSSNLLRWDVFDDLRAAVRRGVKVELYVSGDEARSIGQDESTRAALSGVVIIELTVVGAWCGFCCDQTFVVAGISKANNSPMGRCDAFFGALVSNEIQVEQLLLDVAITSGVPVKKKVRKRLDIDGTR